MKSFLVIMAILVFLAILAALFPKQRYYAEGNARQYCSVADECLQEALGNVLLIDDKMLKQVVARSLSRRGLCRIPGGEE